MAEIQIKPVGASSNIFFLLHGDPGVGKTSFIGAGGKKYKTLLMRTPIDHTDPIVGSGVQEVIVRNWEETFEVLEYMRHDGHEWDWFWVDSLSLLQDVGLDDVYQGVLDAKGAASGDGGRSHRARFGPDRGEYRVNMWRIEEWVRFVVGAGAGFNLGITCHSFWYTPWGAAEAEDQVWPWIQGKQMPQKISAMMNVVGFMETREREVKGEKKESRVIHFNKKHYYAKCQFKLPSGGEIFDGGDLYNPGLPSFVEAVSKGRLQTPADRRTGRTRPSGARPKTRPAINRRTTRKGA